VKQAWKSVSSEVITNSFKTCGISNSTDDSEDNLFIHCLKQGQAAQSAADTVARENTRLLTNSMMVQVVVLRQKTPSLT